MEIRRLFSTLKNLTILFKMWHFAYFIGEIYFIFDFNFFLFICVEYFLESVVYIIT